MNLLSHPCKSPSLSQPSVGRHVKAFMALYSSLQNEVSKAAEWINAAHLISHCMIYLFRKVEKMSIIQSMLTLPCLKSTESFIMMLFRLCWGCVDSTLVNSEAVACGVIKLDCVILYIQYITNTRSYNTVTHTTLTSLLVEQLCRFNKRPQPESLVLINAAVNCRQIYWVFSCYVAIK